MTTHPKPWFKSPIIISVTSLAAILGALGIIWVSMGKANSAIYAGCLEDKVKATAAVVVHDSISPCKVKQTTLEHQQSLTDTNIAVIKSILEVMATNDQLIRARDMRNNPTGIR